MTSRKKARNYKSESKIVDIQSTSPEEAGEVWYIEFEPSKKLKLIEEIEMANFTLLSEYDDVLVVQTNVIQKPSFRHAMTIEFANDIITASCDINT